MINPVTGAPDHQVEAMRGELPGQFKADAG
jgi:hypothetical protein